jgi:hydrogenase 3 maturation protease
MISNYSWQSSLAQTLNQLRQQSDPPGRPLRLAIVGVGHELRGDDAAGGVVVRRLARISETAVPPHILLMDGGHAPENHTGPIRRFAPDLVLFIDVALMDREPGSICWLPWQATSGLSASSHTMPLYMLARFLTAVSPCEVALIGIQPQATSLAATLTPVVETAVAEIVTGLAEIIYASNL